MAAQDKIFKYLENNPIVVVGGVAAVGAYFVWDELVAYLNPTKPTDIKIDMSQVTKPKEVYQSAADQTYTELSSSLVYASSDKLLSFLNGFNDEELKQVYVDFGLRADMLNLQELTQKHDIFWWYENEHGINPLFSLSDLQKRWAGTGLWNQGANGISNLDNWKNILRGIKRIKAMKQAGAPADMIKERIINLERLMK